MDGRQTRLCQLLRFDLFLVAARICLHLDVRTWIPEDKVLEQRGPRHTESKENSALPPRLNVRVAALCDSVALRETSPFKSMGALSLVQDTHESERGQVTIRRL